MFIDFCKVCFDHTIVQGGQKVQRRLFVDKYSLRLATSQLALVFCTGLCSVFSVQINPYSNNPLPIVDMQEVLPFCFNLKLSSPKGHTH